MGEEVPIRYAISIAHHKGSYHAIIFCPSDNSFAQSGNPSLTKLMTGVSKRVRQKEKKMKNFPMPAEPQSNLIVLPNGTR